jgi:hypothetical protein
MAHKKSVRWFPHFARVAATAAGSPAAFAIAVIIVIVWAATGPMFGYSDTWQLVIKHSHNRDFSDGLPHTEYTNSGHRGFATEARRVDPGEQRRA